LEIKSGMGEGRSVRTAGLADVEGHTRVALAAMPVIPVALHLEEDGGNLIGRGFDFLEADDVRALTRHPVLDFRVTCPDAVDVPGRDPSDWRAQPAVPRRGSPSARD